MNILNMVKMINIRLLLTLVLMSSCIRAKKLCDVRVWYLNIVTAEIFDAKLTEDQMSLKESIESLVLNSADNKASRMIGCKVLYMYNDMLKEQFNYVADGSGMALKEIDSESIQNSDEDSKNEFTAKDTNESVNAEGGRNNALEVDKSFENEVSENTNEDETNEKHGNTEQTEEKVDNNDEIDLHNQKTSSEVKPDSSSETRPGDEDMDLNIEKHTLSDNENANEASKNENPNYDDHKDYDLDEIAEDSAEEDVELHQFIDLSNEYSDDLDATEIDDTETDIEQNNIDTSEEIEELSENLIDENAHVPETNKSLSTNKKEPLSFGVCWSLGCSSYEIFVFNTKHENIPETKVRNQLSHDSKRKPGRKKPKLQQTCSLQYFYELLILNATCVTNYSDLEQLNSAINSVSKKSLLSNSDYNEKEESETDSHNLLESINEKEKIKDSIKNEEVTETETPMTENSIDEQENVEETTKNEKVTVPDKTTSENPIDENGKLDKIDSYENEIMENEKRNEENAMDLNEQMEESYGNALHEGMVEDVSEKPSSTSIERQNANIIDKVDEINKDNEGHEQTEVNERAKENNDQKTNNDINDNGNIKHKTESLKEFERMIEQKTNQYYTKIQTLEVLIMKLENQILSEALHKQNHSSTITKLENHVLKLENELLKMNKNYQNLREEADNMSKRQNKYLELAYKQQAKKDYPELPDHSSKHHELISQHQSKLNELAYVIKNQSEMIMHLHKKYESIEDQNRQLHQMVMNQTIFMTSIIKTVQDLSEQNLQNQKEIIQLRQIVNENTDTQSPKGEHKDTERSNANVIDELDSLLFHNGDEKIISAHKEIDIKKGSVGKPHTSESVLHKYLMKEKSAMELVSDWCPKSTSSCPLCQNYSLIKNNCVPFQFMIWYNNKQKKNKQKVKDDGTIQENTEQEKLKDEDNTEEEKLNDNDYNTIKTRKEEKVKGDSLTMDSKKQELQDDSTAKDSKREELKDDTAVKDSTEQDKQEDSSANEKYMPTGYNANTDGSQTAQIKNELQDVALSEEKVTKETVSDESLKYYDGLEKYKILGYDKEGKPVLKLRDDWVEKQKEIEQPNSDEDNIVTNSKDEEGSNSMSAAQEESNLEDANELLEHSGKETHSHQLSTEEQNVKNDTKIELDNGSRLNENVQNEEVKVDDNKITDQDLNKHVKETNDDSPNKDSKEKTDEHIDNVDEELDTDKKTIESSASDKEITNESNINNDLTKAMETDNASNENAEKNSNTQKVAQGTDDKKLEKPEDTSKSTQGSTPQTPKNDESNKEPDLESKNKNIIDEKKETEKSQQQKTKQDNTIKNKDKKDSIKKVDKPKIAQNKTTAAENKPKERKAPINIKENMPKQNEPRDCYDYYIRGDRRDGLYKVKPFGKDNTLEVFCDMRRGGWTVIQRRQDGTTNFFQDWKEYKKGFGGMYGEHWLGNDNIHLLTNQDYYKLRVDLMNWNREKKYAEFEYFLVDNEDEGYRIHIEGYSGDAGDGLTKHDGHKFSTKDVDNDKVVKEFGGSCAKRFYGAGWYYKCYASNLNGRFYKGGEIPDKRYDGVTWKPWTGPNYSLKKVEMKIRPASVK